jgi:hypothetical protein
VCVAKVYPNCSFNILPNYVRNLLLFWRGHSSISNFYSESVTMSRIPWKVTDELKPKYFPWHLMRMRDELMFVSRFYIFITKLKFTGGL